MKKLLFFLLAGSLLTACKHSKPSTTAAAAGLGTTNNLDVIEKRVNENAFEFEYLSFRAGGRFDGLGIQQNISLSFRMKRHETVWISAQAVLGIEVARALITRDSVYIL